MTANDDPLNGRVRLLLTHAVAALDPADRAERIAWCQDNDAHGIRMHPGDDGILEFRWGGRRLALVAAADLAAGAPLAGGFVANTPPDTVPGDWTGR